MKNLKVGICGWGNVATGLFKAINNNADAIEFNSGACLSIEVIGARRDNPKCDPGKTLIERDIFAVLDHDIDVVVELIGGVEVARDLILKAIKKRNMSLLQIKLLFIIMVMRSFNLLRIMELESYSNPQFVPEHQ